jgi:hypothetical protein
VSRRVVTATFRYAATAENQSLFFNTSFNVLPVAAACTASFTAQKTKLAPDLPPMAMLLFQMENYCSDASTVPGIARQTEFFGRSISVHQSPVPRCPLNRIA